MISDELTTPPDIPIIHHESWVEVGMHDGEWYIGQLSHLPAVDFNQGSNELKDVSKGPLAIHINLIVDIIYTTFLEASVAFCWEDFTSTSEEGSRMFNLSWLMNRLSWGVIPGDVASKCLHDLGRDLICFCSLRSNHRHSLKWGPFL